MAGVKKEQSFEVDEWMTRTALSWVLMGTYNLARIDDAIASGGLKAKAGKYRLRDVAPALWQLKNGQKSADRRNIADAELKELQAAVIREKRPDWSDVRALIQGMGAATSAALDDDRFPQEWRVDAKNQIAEYLDKALAKLRDAA